MCSHQSQNPGDALSYLFHKFLSWLKSPVFSTIVIEGLLHKHVYACRHVPPTSDHAIPCRSDSVAKLRSLKVIVNCQYMLCIICSFDTVLR